MKYKYILFDFDGTLFDTSEGIIKGVRHTLEQNGYSVGEDKELYKFIGPPIVQAFKEFYGMTEKQALAAKDLYRKYYREEGLFLCKPIDGAKECLGRLLQAGCTLAVATSKPEMFARAILEKFGFSEYFSLIVGADPEETRLEKSEIISFVLHELQPDNLADVIMVGDRKYDVIGAKKAGLACIGLDSGFSDPGELENAGAAAVVHNYRELSAILLG